MDRNGRRPLTATVHNPPRQVEPSTVRVPRNADGDRVAQQRAADAEGVTGAVPEAATDSIPASDSIPGEQPASDHPGAAASNGTGIDAGNELMLALQHGDDGALKRLVALYNGKLFSFVVRMLGDAASAEDVVQETWLSLYERRDTYEPTYRFSTWLFTIARRKALSELRRRSVRSIVRPIARSGEDGGGFDPPQETYNDPLSAADGALLLPIIERALEMLPPHQREIVLLRDVEGLDNDEIADVLGWNLKPGTVRKRVFDARDAFRRAMHALGYAQD